MNDVLDTLRTTFATAFSSTFTTYFKGKVELIPQDNLPMLMVYPISTNQRHSGTLRDAVEYRIGVQIVVNLKKYLDNSNGDGTKLDTLDALVDLVENRDANGAALSDTIIGILNENITVGAKVLYTDDMQVEYEQYLEANTTVGKATVTFTAKDRPNRTV